MVADALSRIPHLNNIITLSALDLDNLLNLYQQDHYFAPILETLQHPQDATPKELARAKHFELNNQRIYLKEENWLAIPKDKRLRTQILQEHHDTDISGHLGIDKTYELLQRNFYWPKLGKDVYKFVTTCDSCQRNKPSH